MSRNLFTGLRSSSTANRSKPMPLVAKGVGGSTSSIAPKPAQKISSAPSSKVFKSQK